MTAWLAFALYVAAAFVVPALVVYPLHMLLTAMGVAFPFEKLTLRTMELCALVGLWPLLAALGQRGAAAWGFGAPRFWRPALFGAAAGAAMMAAPVAVLVAIEVRIPDPAVIFDAGTMARWVLTALASAVIVAVVEELWFRGALFSALRGIGGVAVAAAVTSLTYALVHFVRPDRVIPPGSEGWGSGLEVIGGSFERLGSIGIWDSFLALCIAGGFLAWRRVASGGVAQCIGLHAGWVLVIGVTRKATDIDPGAPGLPLVGVYDGIIGVGTAAWFAAVALAWRAIEKRRAR